MSCEARFTALAEVLVSRKDEHLCRTAVHRKMFVLRAQLKAGKVTVAIIDGHIEQKKDEKPVVHAGPEAVLVQHGRFQLAQLRQGIETCSGIGCVTYGYKSCGANMKVYNDCNEHFIEWLQRSMKEGRLEECSLVIGDVGDRGIMKKIMVDGDGAGFISAGVSCQPYSRLGDKKGHEDPRSKSLPDTLRLAYYMRRPMVILECVGEAGKTPYVQDQLKQFASLTGYKVEQVTLELSTMWPSRRQRWWAILTHPLIPSVKILCLPSVGFEPVAKHLTDSFFAWGQSDQRQLELDLCELHAFAAADRGINRNLISPIGPCLLPSTRGVAKPWRVRMSQCRVPSQEIARKGHLWCFGSRWRASADSGGDIPKGATHASLQVPGFE